MKDLQRRVGDSGPPLRVYRRSRERCARMKDPLHPRSCELDILDRVSWDILEEELVRAGSRTYSRAERLVLALCVCPFHLVQQPT